jgi:hypothetical protein
MTATMALVRGDSPRSVAIVTAIVRFGSFLLVRITRIALVRITRIALVRITRIALVRITRIAAIDSLTQRITGEARCPQPRGVAFRMPGRCRKLCRWTAITPCRIS